MPDQIISGSSSVERAKYSALVNKSSIQSRKPRWSRLTATAPLPVRSVGDGDYSLLTRLRVEPWEIEAIRHHQLATSCMTP